MKLFGLLDNNITELINMFANSADFYYKKFKIRNISCAIAMCEDLTSLNDLQDMFLKNLSNMDIELSRVEIIDYFVNESTLPVSNVVIKDFETVLTTLTAGFAIMFIDGVDMAISIPVQNYPSRGVDKPTNENNLRGSKESFTDVCRKNMSLIRRRIRTTNLTIEAMQIGEKTNTEIAVVYHKDYCPKELSDIVKKRIFAIKLPTILDAGYITPFIDKTKFSLFSGVGYTEKADTFCAKICEGKVGIIVDGTPYAAIYPYFFSENFSTNDDYSQRPYYSTLIRILRLVSFIIAVALPAIYVAFASYAPQTLANKLLYKIYYSQKSTPLPLFIEAIMINIIFEIVKEAGLRLPDAIGGSVSLISALIIGESAVNVGIVGNTILIVCALSSITSFMLPSLHEAIVFMRMIFIISAGLFGISGLAFATVVLFMNIVNIDTFGYRHKSIYTIKTIFKDGLVKDSFRNEKGKGFSLNNVKK